MTLGEQVLEGAAFSARMLYPGHSQYADLSKMVPRFHSHDRRIHLVTGAVGGSEELDAMQKC